MGMGVDVRNRMARRAAEEIHNGMIVNLGIGIPSLVPNHLPNDMKVMFHAENGIVGMGPSPLKGKEDENLCNAGGFPVTLSSQEVPIVIAAIAFAMIRRGRVDMTILGSLQVSQNGDLGQLDCSRKKSSWNGRCDGTGSKSKKSDCVNESL